MPWIGGKPRGMMLVWFTIILASLMAFVSLGVDLGRVQLAKTELQRAADAAARYGVTGLSNGTHLNKAQAAASANTSDGMAISLLASDVEAGTWNNGAFTAGGASPNALRVTAYRTAARGNAVALLFARVLGQTTCDVSASAITTISTTSGAGYGLQGLTDFDVEDHAVVDSYNSTGGDYSSGSANATSICKSNGDIVLKNHAQIQGEAHPGIGKTVTTNDHSSVTGNTAPLTSTLGYPDVDTGAAASSNNNGAVPSSFLNASRDFTLEDSDTCTLPPGTYYFNKVTVKNHAGLDFSGAVTIYATGAVKFEDHATVTPVGNLPANIKIMVSGSDNHVDVKNHAQLAANIYNPHGKYRQSDHSSFMGVVMADDVELKNHAQFHMDEALANSGASSSSTGAISTVK